jgi:hypothetical protein
VPFSKPLQEDFLPAVLTHEDYPNLIEPGGRIDTVAVGCVLFAYNWADDTDRYQRLVKFVNVFFPRLAEFRKPPRHPKWREANLAATLPGWKRFGPAEEWLKRHREETSPAERQKFDDFLAARGQKATRQAAASDDERERLFQEYLKWKRARERR